MDIEHPPGEEIQWDWLELPDTPWSAKAYVLVGALAHSGAYFATGPEFVPVLLRQRDHARDHNQTDRADLFDTLIERAGTAIRARADCGAANRVFRQIGAEVTSIFTVLAATSQA